MTIEEQKRFDIAEELLCCNWHLVDAVETFDHHTGLRKKTFSMVKDIYERDPKPAATLTVKALKRMATWGQELRIRNVIFNDPATIIVWNDGTKTVVKCGEDEIFDPEKGLAMAIVKKALGNKGNYYNQIKKWLPEKKDDGSILSEGAINAIKIAINNLRKALLGQAEVQFDGNTLNIHADGSN